MLVPVVVARVGHGHGRLGAEEYNLIQPGAADGLSGWVGDVEEWDFEVFGELVGYAVQGVGSAYEQVGAGAFGGLGFGER